MMKHQTVFRREVAEKDADLYAKSINSIFNANINTQDIFKAAENIKKIEDKMEGRIAGDIDDYILNFFLHKFAAQKNQENRGLYHVEIGSLFGGSLIVSALAIQEEHSSHKLIGVDPLDGYYRQDPVKGSKDDMVTGIPVTMEVLASNLKKFGLNDLNWIEVWQHYSTEDIVKKNVQHIDIIVLFIDGDHTYNGIKNDWDTFSPRVIEGGYILIDNYNDHSWPEVTDFLHSEILPNSGDWEVQMVLNRTVLLKKITPSTTINLTIHSCYKRRKEALDKIGNQILKLKAKHAELKNQHAELKNQHAELKNQHAKLKNQHAKLKNKLKALEDGFITGKVLSLRKTYINIRKKLKNLQ